MAQKGVPMDRTNIAYGHNQKDRVIVEFSQPVRTLLMTPAEAAAMAMEIQNAMKKLEAYQKEHGIAAAGPREAANG